MARLPRSVPPAMKAILAFGAQQAIRRHPIGRAALLAYGASKAVRAARAAGSESKLPGKTR